VIVVFIIPDGVPAGWELGDLWNSATNIPGIRVIRDQGGRKAHRFDVEGSGHVLLYAPSGKLLFSGGITASRGGEGDNAGHADKITGASHPHAPPVLRSGLQDWFHHAFRGISVRLGLVVQVHRGAVHLDVRSEPVGSVSEIV
jgi:hypothetical protein